MDGGDGLIRPLIFLHLPPSSQLLFTLMRHSISVYLRLFVAASFSYFRLSRVNSSSSPELLLLPPLTLLLHPRSLILLVSCWGPEEEEWREDEWTSRNTSDLHCSFIVLRVFEFLEVFILPENSHFKVFFQFLFSVSLSMETQGSPGWFKHSDSFRLRLLFY